MEVNRIAGDVLGVETPYIHRTLKRRKQAVGLTLGTALIVGLAWLLFAPRSPSSPDERGRGEGNWAQEIAEWLSPAPEVQGARPESPTHSALEPDAGFAPEAVDRPWLPSATVTAAPNSRHGGVAGRVVSEVDGVGIEGAELTFAHGNSSLSVHSGPGGHFSFEAPAQDVFSLAIATADGFAPFAPQWGHSPLTFRSQPHRRIEAVVIRLRPLTRFSVRVEDQEGNPVAGAQLELLEDGLRWERALVPLGDGYRTDEAGQAEVEAFRWALIEASHPEHGLARDWARGDRPTVIRLRPDAREEGASISGRVVDEAGAPIGAAMVRAWTYGPSAPGQTSTGPDGTFSIEGVDRRRRYTLTVAHPSYREGEAQAEAGSDEVEIVLAAGGALHGRVVDDEGRPVPAFRIRVRRADAGLYQRTVGGLSRYDAEGRFELSGLPEGNLEVVATSRGYPPSEPVTFTADEGTQEIVLRLQRGGRVEGVVRGTGGEPVAGAVIVIAGRRGRVAGVEPDLSRALTASDGSFALDGIGSAPTSIRVEADGYHPRLLSGTTVAAGGTRRLEVQLTELEEGEEPELEFVGIGVNVMARDQRLIVRRIFSGGGAEEAGLARGDEIVRVDGVPVAGLRMDGALERIRGREGTSVVLRIQRGEESFDVQIVRRRLRS